MTVVVINIGWEVTQGATVPLPAWAGTSAVTCIFALFINGVYLFFQHYGSRWRRGRSRSMSSILQNSGG